MKKNIIIVILLLYTLSGFSQNFYVTGNDTLTGRPGYLYKMRPLYVAGSITRINDSTISAPITQTWDSSKNWTVTPSSSYPTPGWTFLINNLTTSIINGITLRDTTVATSGVQNQNPPALMFEGRRWTGSVSARDSMQLVYRQAAQSLDFVFNNQSKMLFANTPSITVGGGSQMFTSSILTTTFTGATVNSSANNSTLTLQDRSSTTGTVTGINALTGTVSNTSNSYTGINFKPTINETSGTATNDIILVNPTITAFGSGEFNLLRLDSSSVDQFKVNKSGKVTFAATNTAGGTTGNQTINRPTGTVNIAASNTSVTVTNNLVTTSSIVYCVIRTNDATATIKNVVPSSGSFVITLNAATTAETSIGFIVFN